MGRYIIHFGMSRQISNYSIDNYLGIQYQFGLQFVHMGIHTGFGNLGIDLISNLMRLGILYYMR